MLLSLASFIYLVCVIIMKILSTTTPGWASIVAVSLFFNGITLIILGIMGEYVGRIFDEVKKRPLYVVRDKVNFDDNIE